ncbi:MAG: hypothetical protein V3S55_08330 [Nitrospiraceae bacterium]
MASSQTGVERWAVQLSYKAADGSTVRVYDAYPKQTLFHNDSHKYRFFGGAAGPGKSLALMMEAVMDCHEAGEYAPEVHTLLLRRTYPELEGSLLKLFREKIPPDMYSNWNEQKKTITWRNRSTTRFGSMQYERNAMDYSGHEYLFIGWDELTRFLLRQWQTLKVWNRCPVSAGGQTANMAGAGNPIGIGAVWVRAMFVKKQPAPGMDIMERQRYNPKQYGFIPALVWDNPVYADNKEYIESLNSLPRVLRAAMLEGRWDIAIGAYFDIFDEAAMTIPAQEIRMEKWWPRWLSGDWGFEHNCAIYWHTMSPEGVAYTYRELVINHTGPEDLGKMIAERSIDSESKPEKLSGFYFSHDAFAQRTDRATIAGQLRKAMKAARKDLPGPSPASRDRIGGWMLMYELLRGGRWLIGRNCTQLIEVLPLLPRHEVKVEDCEAMPGVDDPADGARYGLYGRLRAKQVPRELRIARATEKIPDPTMRHLEVLRLRDKDKKKSQPWKPKRGIWRPH